MLGCKSSVHWSLYVDPYLSPEICVSGLEVLVWPQPSYHEIAVDEHGLHFKLAGAQEFRDDPAKSSFNG